MTTLTVIDLKDLLRKKNLPTTGSKTDLVKRLLEAGVLPEELRRTDCTPDEIDSDELPEGARAQTVIPTLREVELLRKERDLTARETELLRRELELLRMAPRPDKDAFFQANIKKWQELKDLVGEFDGNNLDFERWEKQIKQLLSSYDLDDHKAKALVCSRLSGKALKWYHSRADCVELNSNSLLQELKKMYGQRPDQLSLRREFEARVWNAGETFTDYLHDKVTLANRVPISDTEIISYIIEGIPSQE